MRVNALGVGLMTRYVGRYSKGNVSMYTRASVSVWAIRTTALVVFVLSACAGSQKLYPTCNMVSAAKRGVEFRAIRDSAKDMFDLGQKAEMTTYCEENGSSIARDPDLIVAYMWYEVALRNGHPLAERARDRLSKKMTDGEIGEAQKRIMIWMEHYGKQR